MLGYNEIGYNELDYNELVYNELGYNKLGYNELGYNELGYNELVYYQLWLWQHNDIVVTQIHPFFMSLVYNEQLWPIPVSFLNRILQWFTLWYHF